MTGTPPLVIRDASSSDAVAIARIYNQSIEARDSTMVMDPVSGDDMAGKLATLASEEHLLVGQLDDQVLGWGIVKLYSDRPGYARACETSVFLDRDHLGKGWGSQIQSVLMERARLSGFHHVLVRIWTANESSIAMHRKFGFTEVGVQREIGFMDGRFIDVTVMQAIL